MVSIFPSPCKLSIHPAFPVMPALCAGLLLSHSCIGPLAFWWLTNSNALLWPGGPVLNELCVCVCAGPLQNKAVCVCCVCVLKGEGGREQKGLCLATVLTLAPGNVDCLQMPFRSCTAFPLYHNNNRYASRLTQHTHIALSHSYVSA